MPKSIYVYAEQFEGQADPSAAELVYAAKKLDTESEITVFAFGEEDLIQQLSYDGVKILLINGENPAFYEEKKRAEIIKQIISIKAPDYVLLPAIETVKPVFARVAAALQIGMTADCTELFMEDGVFYQKKPAFGENAMVITKEEGNIAFVTVITGAYPPEQKGTPLSKEYIGVSSSDTAVILKDTEVYTSKNIQDAEILLSLGRGAAQAETLELAEKLAERLGGFVGGTRPLVDLNLIPFEAQIGQTGCTVHPKICLFFGVSGAIQHTEGVKDTKLTVAVNTDEKAGIFSFAQYGTILDCKEVLTALYNLYGGDGA